MSSKQTKKRKRKPTIDKGKRMLSIYQARAELNNSRSAERRQIKDGLLTEPVYRGPRTREWPEHEIAIIKAARIAGATDDEIREVVQELMKARRKIDWRKMLAEVV